MPPSALAQPAVLGDPLEAAAFRRRAARPAWPDAEQLQLDVFRRRPRAVHLHERGVADSGRASGWRARSSRGPVPRSPQIRMPQRPAAARCTRSMTSRIAGEVPTMP